MLGGPPTARYRLKNVQAITAARIHSLVCTNLAQTDGDTYACWSNEILATRLGNILTYQNI